MGTEATSILQRPGWRRVEAPFDMPWLNSQVNEGYNEKFPSGVVEKMFSSRIEIRWHPRTAWFLSLHLAHSRYDDFQNQPGTEKSFTEVSVKGWWEIDRLLGLE